MNYSRLAFIAIALSFLGASHSVAQDPSPGEAKDFEPVKTKRVSYAYEQCYLANRIALDKKIAHCSTEQSEIVRRQPDFETSNPDINGDAGFLYRCYSTAISEFKKTLARCPVDRGREGLK